QAVGLQLGGRLPDPGRDALRVRPVRPAVAPRRREGRPGGRTRGSGTTKGAATKRSLQLARVPRPEGPRARACLPRQDARGYCSLRARPRTAGSDSIPVTRLWNTGPARRPATGPPAAAGTARRTPPPPPPPRPPRRPATGGEPPRPVAGAAGPAGGIGGS